MAGVTRGSSATASLVRRRRESGGGDVWPVSRDWSSLPESAVYLTLKHLLPGVQDVFSLGNVCKGWRSTFTACKRELFSALPLLVERGSSPAALAGFFNLMEGKSYRRRQTIFLPWILLDGYFYLLKSTIVGVSHGYWIVFGEFCWRSGYFPVSLVDPLSPEARIDLPPVQHCIRSGLLTAHPTSPDCVVIGMTYPACMLYCRLGDTEWTRHSLCEGRDASDRSSWTVDEQHQIAVLGKKVYALASNGKLMIIELLFPRPSVTVVEVKGLPRGVPGSCAPLVESNGEILCVADEGRVASELGGTRDERHRCRKEHRFVVRRLDLAAGKWVTLSTLGDRSLFLNRRGTSLSITCGAARWEHGGDRIYCFCLHSDAVVVFHMKDGSVDHLPLPEEHTASDWMIPSFCCL